MNYQLGEHMKIENFPSFRAACNFMERKEYSQEQLGIFEEAQVRRLELPNTEWRIFIV